MRTAPAGLAATTVAAEVAKGWGLPVSRLRYVALGGGSYHWVAAASDGGKYFLTVDDLQDKPWLGADPDSAFRGLRAAFDTALTLRDQARLDFVVAPVPSVYGQSARRLTPHYSLAVFPHVAGQAGRWGTDLTRRDRNELAHLLGELHRSTPAVEALARRRDAALPGRAGLEAALGDLDQPWTGGPFAEQARAALAAGAGTVRDWLAAFDSLAAHLLDSDASLVVTHGEPHPGNIMRAGSQLMLIDWDTVALAPPERDLWMLDDAPHGVLARYSKATGRTVDTIAINYYRLAWTLADIASFTGRLRSAHARDRDTEHAWQALKISLDPESLARSGPFGRGQRRRWWLRPWQRAAR
jgi:spectinomycin phosphotransferase